MDFFKITINITILIIYILLNLIGLTLLKNSQSIISYHGIGGMFLYGLGFIIWLFVILRAMPLSIAFPLAAGSLMIGTQIFGYYFLNEKISFYQLAGVLMIVIGLCLIYINGVNG